MNEPSDPSRRALLIGAAAAGALLVADPAAAMPTPQRAAPLVKRGGEVIRVPIGAQALSVELDGVALRPGRDYSVGPGGELTLSRPRPGARVASAGYQDARGSWRWSSWRLA